MNLFESIEKLIRRAGRGHLSNTNGPESQKNTAEDMWESWRLREILDGMGTGTARIIIDREASRCIAEPYRLKGLENKGRYYVVRVVRPDGSLIDELLVDKQNGRIQFMKRFH
jgi:hypothetical protein